MAIRTRTANYTQEARERLASAVSDARMAAGYRFRTDFVAANPDVKLKPLELLETAKVGVGPTVLAAVAKALGWPEDAPRAILEGGQPPLPAEPPPLVSPALHSTQDDLSDPTTDWPNLTRAQQRRRVRQLIDQLPLVLQHYGQAAYEASRDHAIKLIVKYGDRDGE